MGLNPCGKVVKVFLVFFNFFYVVVGFIVGGVGATLLIEKEEFQVLTGDDNLIVGIGFIVAGFFTVLVGFLGIVSSIGEMSPLLLVYAVLTVGLIGVEVAGASVCYSERNRITQGADDKFLEYMEKYRDPSSDDYDGKINDVIDIAQNGFECCGLVKYNDWLLHNPDYVLTYSYPSSCSCNKDTDGSKCIQLYGTIEGVWSDGCNHTFYGTIRSNFSAIGGSGMGIAAVQIITVVLALSLFLFIMCEKARKRRIARTEAATYTQLDSYPNSEDEEEEERDQHNSQATFQIPVPSSEGSPYTTRTVNNELEPNDDIDVGDRSMYIQ